jgi:virulence-associated protein VapD
MFAIAFDMDIKELRNSYGEPYNNAYYEIKIILRKYNFFNTQGSVYLTDKDDMANLFAAIYALKKITWFKNAVRDIRAFKVENWSDFTQIVKEDD